MNEKYEALLTAFEYSSKLENGISLAAIRYQEFDIENGDRLIEPILEGIKWLMDIFSLTRDVQRYVIDIEKMNKPIQYLMEAIENGDYFYLGEVLEYEILPIIKMWAQLVEVTISKKNIELN